jgi:hypothetical protein
MHSTKSTDVKRNSRPAGQYHIAPSGFVQSGSNMQEMVEIQPKINHKMVEIQPTHSPQKHEENIAFSVIEQVVMQGDLSKLNSEQRVIYYRRVCESAGLNPLTRPFDYILLNGKLTLYAKKDCTEQLRKLNGVSIERLEDKFVDDLYIVKAFAKTKDGRMDAATGAVTIGNLKGEAKANAIMKAETKAKRRVTLSISGMGWTDESEVDSIPSAKHVDIDMSTGEFKGNSTELNRNTPQKKPMHSDQVHELEDILAECDERYTKTFYQYLKNAYGFDHLSGAPEELYARIKNAAMQNARETLDRKTNAIKSEEMVCT